MDKWDELKELMEEYYRKPSTCDDEKYAIEIIFEFMVKLDKEERK